MISYFYYCAKNFWHSDLHDFVSNFLSRPELFPFKLISFPKITCWNDLLYLNKNITHWSDLKSSEGPIFKPRKYLYFYREYIFFSTSKCSLNVEVYWKNIHSTSKNLIKSPDYKYFKAIFSHFQVIFANSFILSMFTVFPTISLENHVV